MAWLLTGLLVARDEGDNGCKTRVRVRFAVVSPQSSFVIHPTQHNDFLSHVIPDK